MIKYIIGDLQQVHQGALQGAPDCGCCLSIHGLWNPVPASLGGNLCLDSKNKHFYESVSVICVVQNNSELSFNTVSSCILCPGLKTNPKIYSFVFN